MVIGPAGPRRGGVAMSDNRKPKPKRKRSHTVYTVLADTPLTMHECVDRLRSGRFPIRSVSAHIHPEDQHLTIELIAGRWTSSIWRLESVSFEGSFAPTDKGLTRIHGQIKQSLSLSYQFFAAQSILLALIGMLLLLSFSIRHHTTATLSALGLLWFVIMAGSIMVFMVNKRRADHLAHELESWLSSRLDI